jgi:prolyl oligopeptidase
VSLTFDWWDRYVKVAPLHSYKYIATVQNTLGKEEFQTNPLLIRIDTKVNINTSNSISLFSLCSVRNKYFLKIQAGHGAGKPTDKIIKEYADMYAFFAYTTNIQWMD